jgi:hypothetical protein
MKRFLPLLLLPLLVSCFHKNVMTDRADDVEASFVYNGKSGPLIITKEMIFQASSKESNGGMTKISGRAEYRISSYDPATGNLVGRAEMGDGIDDAFVIMGTTEGKIWLYSIDPELGLHCRDPRTMEVISTEKILSASSPLKGFAFARPEFSKLDDHYGWNAKNGLLMISDMQDYHYFYDPDKGTLTKTEEEIPDYDWAKNPLNSSGYFGEDDYVSIKGSGRQKLTIRYIDSTGKLSFLNAAILIDNDPLHEMAREKAYADSLSRLLAAYKDSLAQLLKKYPGLDDETSPRARYTEEAYQASWKKRGYENKAEHIERDLKRTTEPHFNVYDNAVLSDGSGDFFLVHAADVSDTARMNISKLHKQGFAISETWTTPMKNYFRDPDKADDKGAFETVFSDGDPRFDYQWFAVFNDKLIFISQLQMACLDVKTGKILWEKPL